MNNISLTNLLLAAILVVLLIALFAGFNLEV